MFPEKNQIGGLIALLPAQPAASLGHWDLAASYIEGARRANTHMLTRPVHEREIATVERRIREWRAWGGQPGKGGN